MTKQQKSKAMQQKSKTILFLAKFNFLLLVFALSLSLTQQFIFANNGGGEPVTPKVPDVDAGVLRRFNPLLLGEKGEVFMPGDEFSPAAFINEALNIIFPLAGLALFVMIVWGGFEMLTGVANKQSLDAGKQRVQAAIIGFLILFASYWIIQIVETITGVSILG